MTRNIALGLLALVLSTSPSPLAGQTLQAGYGLRTEALPKGSSAVLRLPGGDLIYFDGKDLIRQGSGRKSVLLSFPTTTFASFTLALDRSNLLFGENSKGGLWQVPLGSSARPRKLATLALNYAAVRHGGRVLISAKPGGFASKDSEVHALDPSSGVLDKIAVLPGASGPLAVDARGNLYYATVSNSFPAPRGGADVLRFSAAQVQGALGRGHLSIAQAYVLRKGLDTASSMTIDQDGDLFLVDWMNRQVLELSDVHRPFPRLSTLLKYPGSGPSPAGLQFIPGQSAAPVEFEPFQPAGGGTLLVHESDFSSGTSELRSLMAAPIRCRLSSPSPVPAGRRFAVQVQGGPSGSRGFLALGLGPSQQMVEFRLRAEQPLLWSTRLLQPLLLTSLRLDAQGNGQLALLNPGFTNPLPLVAQGYFPTADPAIAGTSEARNFLLQ